MNNFLFQTFKLLSAIWQLGENALTSVWGRLEPYAVTWLAIAGYATVIYVSTVAGLIIVGIGVSFFFQSGIALSIVAIPIGLTITALWLVWSPLAVLVGVANAIVHGRVLSSLKEGEDVGVAYLYAIQAVLLYELTFCLIASLLPFWQKPLLIPAFVATSIALGLAIKVWGGRPFFSRLAYLVLVAYFVYIIGAWVFPATTARVFNVFFADQAISETIEERGILGGAWDAGKNLAFGKSTPKPQITPPPRDIGWMSYTLQPNVRQKIGKVYNGDLVEYVADEAFYAVVDNKKKFYRNPSAFSGEIRRFHVEGVKHHGELMYVTPVNKNVSLEIRIFSK